MGVWRSEGWERGDMKPQKNKQDLALGKSRTLSEELVPGCTSLWSVGLCWNFHWKSLQLVKVPDHTIYSKQRCLSASPLINETLCYRMSDFFPSGSCWVDTFIVPMETEAFSGGGRGLCYDIPTPCENGYCVKANFICRHCCPGSTHWPFFCIKLYFYLFYYFLLLFLSVRPSWILC